MSGPGSIVSMVKASPTSLVSMQNIGSSRLVDRKPLEEQNGLCFLAGLARTLLFVAGHETVGVDNRGASFALADVAAERERLTEGESALPGKSELDYGSPENQNVNPAILPVSRRVLRHREWRFCRGRPPGLDPGHSAGFKFGDDLVGDFLIEARPVLAGARPNSMF